MTQFYEQLIKFGLSEFNFERVNELIALKKQLLIFTNETLNSNINDLENLHLILNSENLNEFRQKAISCLNQQTHFRHILEQSLIDLCAPILGPDLVIQKNINLVISLPQDETSQIPLHCDTLTGHSNFELTLWLPLTRVFSTQSMFILPYDKWQNSKKTAFSKNTTIQKMLTEWQDDIKYLNLNFGSAVIFWHALPHGNTVNHESLTRWSLNIRVKNIFSPYGDKKLGDYFKILQLSPFSQMALKEEHS